MKRPRVIMADDHSLILAGLRRLVETECDVVATVEDGRELLAAAERVNPDLILLDISMPLLNGLDAARQLSKILPDCKLIFLTMHASPAYATEAFQAGASGYLLKGTPRAGLIKAIEGTAAGQTFIDPSVAGKLFTHVAGTTVVHDSTVAESLSPREHEILRLLANGRSNTDIATQLFLSEGTVRNYVSGIFTKLGVTDRTQAAVIALRHGLVD